MTTSPPSSLPDVELVVIDWLKNTASAPWTTVDRVPPSGFDGTQAVVLVSRMGGAWIDTTYEDVPIIQLECYGSTKLIAMTVAMAARARLLAIDGFADGGATVVMVTECDGPRWLPDYLHNGANRYVSMTQLNLRMA
ncbi:hypothetical protein [Catenulispora rubra]|uniref:hypothetical protein n=1 Tax=Catenulispora rubra TaxID=280293 RepID=UPI001892120B|nr:hypothetical protein [Catenulispora rubra]